VVKDDGRIAVRPVCIGEIQGEMWLVNDGLREGDRVVVDGFQKFAPGDSVKPEAWIDAAASSDHR
jgi:membrane fusion protein (multidrug efflux system)